MQFGLSQAPKNVGPDLNSNFLVLMLSDDKTYKIILQDKSLAKKYDRQEKVPCMVNTVG